MKLLLLNPGFFYNSPYLQITEPLGILYLAAYIRERSGHDVSVLDCVSSKFTKKISPQKYWYGLTHEEMLREIGKNEPDMIGISCMFSRKKDDFFAAAKAVREKFPQAKLVAGGTFPSLSPDEVMKSGLFDYCIIGEAEASLLELINSLADKKPLNNIDGIVFRSEDGIFQNPKVSFMENLDDIPFPARDLIDYDAYLTRKIVVHGLGLRRTASVLTSRSCPNRCNFCSMFKIHGPRWRGRGAGNIVDELVHLRRDYAVRDFFIMDDNFTFKKPRAMEFCERLCATGLKFRWNTPNGISIKTLDRELLAAMKKSGCVSICIAIETGDEELRNNVIGKRLTNDKIREAAETARDLGLLTTAFYIIGMPGETEEKFQNTLDQIRTLPLNGVAAAFANPLPGTKLYDDCVKNGWIIKEDGGEEENVFYKPYLVTKDFSEQDLISREKRFYRTFLKAKFFVILKDTIFFRNKLLYPPFLLRILKDRIIR